MESKTFFISTTRLENFSDGVFAIILTLLAFQFKVPNFSNDVDIIQNWHELVMMTPRVLGFIFSFLFIGVFWVNHHHLYHAVKETNSALLWYNINFLFWITMLPFAIAMVGDYPQIPLAAVCLGFDLLMTSIAAYLLLHYSYVKSKLVDETLSHESIKDGLNKNLLGIIITIVGILVAFKWVYISYCIYFVVLLIFVNPIKIEKTLRGRRQRTLPRADTDF